jgi:hypothetical protein
MKQIGWLQVHKGLFSIEIHINIELGRSQQIFKINFVILMGSNMGIEVLEGKPVTVNQNILKHIRVRQSRGNS